MRYSIIHHDIREKFNLSLHEYVVCDSIHQLSHTGPTFKKDSDIAEFLGLERSTVTKIKARLLEKGLIEGFDEGFRTTVKWYDEVTHVNKSHRSDRITKNVIPSHPSIYKEVKNISDKSQNESSEPIIEVPVLSDGEERPSRIRAPKADVSYRDVFLAFSPTYPRNWNLNKTQIQAAKNLLEERGLKQVRGALKFHSENKEREFCPNILTPYDLDSKWSKLFAFKNRS